MEYFVNNLKYASLNDLKNCNCNLSDFNDALVIKDNFSFHLYKSDLIEVDSIGNSISINLLNDFLSDLTLYHYLLKVIKNNLNFKIKLINFNTLEAICIPVSILIKGLNHLHNNSYVDKMHLEYLNSLADFNNIFNVFNDYTHSFLYDGKVYKLCFMEIYNILSMNDDNFISFLNGDKLYKYDSNLMKLIISDFLQREHIKNRFVLNDKVLNRINQIINLSDYELSDEIFKYDSLIVNNCLRYSNGINKLYDVINVFDQLTKINPDDFVQTFEIILRKLNLHPFINLADENNNSIRFKVGNYELAYNDRRLICLNADLNIYNSFYRIYNNMIISNNLIINPNESFDEKVSELLSLVKTYNINYYQERKDHDLRNLLALYPEFKVIYVKNILDGNTSSIVMINSDDKAFYYLIKYPDEIISKVSAKYVDNLLNSDENCLEGFGDFNEISQNYKR